jgi:AraC-like DNA-binding protein
MLPASPSGPRGGPAAAPGHCTHIAVVEVHRIRTLMVRDDLLVCVRHGRKTLVAPEGSLQSARGEGLLMARGTQWDVINDPSGAPRYEALVLAFGNELVHALEPRLAAAAAPVASARCLAVDDELDEATQRAASFLRGRAISVAVQRHRLMEVLLLLAERGHRFIAAEQLEWDERVRRLIAQRPEADWTVDALAQNFHVSASTLRRRIEGRGVTLAGLVREVRLETALTLLQSTPHAIGAIALRCGWESHSRFSAAFQERWGFAPSVMRSRLMRNG